MPRFDIIYSDEPTTKALFAETIVARDRVEASSKAMLGLRSAQLKYGARCYRVIDGQGMVVTRGPNSVITRATE